jgi:hypothetical protein
VKPSKGGALVSLRTRLERLEGTAGGAGSFTRSISREALKALSDEELDALEDVLEARDAAKPGGTDEDLYAAATERGRRALDAYTYALEAVRRGERRGA